MNNFIITIKGTLTNNKLLYIAEDNGTFYYLKDINSATVYEPVMIYEAEQRLMAELKQRGLDTTNELKRKTIKKG